MRKHEHRKILLIFLEMLFVVQARAGFRHPGLLHSRADLERMREMVSQDVEPYKSGFEIFKSDPASQLDDTIRGAGAEIFAQDGTRLE